MSVLDKLPDGEPLRLLREVNQNAQEIKAPQTLGAASVVTSRVFSDDDYDIELPSSGGPHTVEIEFIPDDLTFGGALCYQLYAVNVTDPGFPGVTSPDRLRVTANRQRWVMRMQNNDRYKFYFFAAGSGTFTATLI